MRNGLWRSSFVSTETKKNTQTNQSLVDDGRAHNYRLERARILPPTDADSSAALKESLLALDQQMLRAEEYLKGPLDESTGERFWTMAAHRSWWVKAPEGPLGSPPSP